MPHVEVAATKTAFDKINMNVFPPICLGQHCRVGLGTDSTWDKKRSKSQKCLTRSEGWQVPSLTCPVYSEMVGSGQSPSAGSSGSCDINKTKVHNTISHYPRGQDKGLHVFNQADMSGEATCQS